MIAAPSPRHQLAQVNVARLLAPLEDPRIADFRDNLERVNRLAERMEGFVWRHVDDSGNATDTRVGEDPMMIYNASVWRDGAALDRFVWGTLHAQFYRRRAEWFSVLGAMHMAMWWVPEGHRPSPAEAMARLARIEAEGPGAQAFGWAEVPGAVMWRAGRCGPLAAE